MKHGKRDLDNFTLEVTDKQQLDVMSPLCILQGKPEERTKVRIHPGSPWTKSLKACKESFLARVQYVKVCSQ